MPLLKMTGQNARYRHKLSFHNLLLVFLVLFCLCAKVVVAADGSTPSQSASSKSESSKESPTPSSTPASNSPSDSAKASPSPDKNESKTSSVSASATPSGSESASKSDSGSASPSKSNSGSASPSKSISSQPGVTITASNTIATDSASKPLLTPVLITASNTLNNGASSGLPGLKSMSAMPTLSFTGIPIPTVVVPLNDNNPFMKQSTLPEGTVFIAVGAILLGIFLAVVGWNLAMFVIAKNAKDIEYTPAGGFGSKGTETKPIYTDDNRKGDGAGMSQAGGNKNAGAQSGLVGAHKENAMYKSGLFFSPTAEVMSSAQNNSMMGASMYGGPADSLTSTANSAGLGVGAPRSSAYMPSGYYAPTTSVGNAGNATTSVYNTAPSIQNQNLSPNRNSTLAAKDSVRAPSAYLDDFLRQE